MRKLYVLVPALFYFIVIYGPRSSQVTFIGEHSSKQRDERLRLEFYLRYHPGKTEENAETTVRMAAAGNEPGLYSKTDSALCLLSIVLYR